MSRLLAEIAIPKNPNVQDKFEVTVNNVANHPANFEAFDFDETVQMAKTYLDGVVPLQAQAESQLGGSQWSDEDWETLQKLGLCGALLLLRGRVESGLLLLIAVALVSKKDPGWDRKNNQKLKANQITRTRRDGWNKSHWPTRPQKTPKRPKRREWSNPKEG